MKGFSKFFTPPFSRADREAFFSCVGLSMLDFLFVEMNGPLVLRARQFVGSEAEALLSEPCSESADRRVILRHPGQALEISPLEKTRSLWEEVFPYPFDLIGAHFAEGGARLRLAPESWRDELYLLWQVLGRLEERMSLTEVSCLWVKGAHAEMPVLFHFVRRKRVRVGTDSHLYTLSEKYKNGSLTPETLQGHFGTQAAFYHLNLENEPATLDLPRLVTRVSALLEEPPPIAASTSLSPGLQL